MRETNTEFITRIMEVGCPTGALIQPFVIEALTRYAQQVAESPAIADTALLSGEAWKETGEWLLSEINKRYD